MVESNQNLKSTQMDRLNLLLSKNGIYPSYFEKDDAIGFKLNSNTSYRWYSDLNKCLQYLKDVDSRIVVFANEFYDAMPIHRFRYFPDKGWREDMVNAQDDQLYIETSQGETEAIHKFIKKEATILNLPENSMEIAPMWYDITESLCSLIKLKKGAALIIDYGDEGYYGDSLRVVCSLGHIQAQDNFAGRVAESPRGSGFEFIRKLPTDKKHSKAL
jgi:hypothetical protein